MTKLVFDINKNQRGVVSENSTTPQGQKVVFFSNRLKSGIDFIKPIKIAVSLISVITLLFFAPPKELNKHLSLVSAQEQETEEISDNNQNLSEQRQELENQLAGMEKQIDEYRKTIEEYQKQGKTLNNEIKLLNTKIEKLNLEIKTVNLNLTKINQQINDTQRQINRTENKIENHKEAISLAMRQLYETDRQTLIAVLIANNSLSDFFGAINDITLLQNNLQIALGEVVKLRQELLEQKQELSLQKEDAENLRAINQAQKKGVENTQNQKTQLLKVTKGKESEYQKILTKTQETAAQIRSRIFELLGGGELTFEKAYDFAKLAEGATGVKSALILAVLNRESLLGKNTGRCKYDEINPRSGKTNMSSNQIPIFLAILKKIGLDPSSIAAKISCPNPDGTYGGAMGPAQFMPSTWKIFEDRISKITNNNPPSPWNNADAFVATALYLQQYGAASKNISTEKKAAAIYYCGSNWQRTACSYYANKVIETASQFQKDIDILNANS